jgi:hypothetical protein
MRWCLGLVLLGALVLAPPVRAQDPNAWQAECRSERPLRTDTCRVVHYSNDEADAVLVVFSYIDRELNLLILGDQMFTQAQVSIDENQIYFTLLCGEGYCFFNGSLAEKLARHFRRGRGAVIEIGTSSFGVDLIQRLDLAGFETAFAELQNGRRR